jgi:hypothetical protein
VRARVVVSECPYVCVCWCVRERERQREREYVCVYVCVCMGILVQNISMHVSRRKAVSNPCDLCLGCDVVSDQCHVSAGEMRFSRFFIRTVRDHDEPCVRVSVSVSVSVSAQVGTMMSKMEYEADRVRAQIEAALLDTTFSPSSAFGGVHSPSDNSILDLYNAGQRTHSQSVVPALCEIAPCSKSLS